MDATKQQYYDDEPTWYPDVFHLLNIEVPASVLLFTSTKRIYVISYTVYLVGIIYLSASSVVLFESEIYKPNLVIPMSY